MKRIVKFLILFVLLFAITGCANNENNGNRVNNAGSVEDVINSQIENETESADTETEEIPEQNISEMNPAEQESGDVDYDLTSMSSDMVYATVYQMMVDPDTYIGKTIRMDGLYYAVYYEPTEQYYHYCIIQDALACCAQGMEFVWGDGSHIYPDEYPQENASVVVQGVFETYREEGDDNLYCRLKDALLEVNDN